MKNGFTHRVAFSSISNILWWLLAKTIHSFSTRELHLFLTLKIYRPYIYYIKVNFICRESQLLLTECIKNDVLWQDFTVSCTKTICCHFKLCRKIKKSSFFKTLTQGFVSDAWRQFLNIFTNCKHLWLYWFWFYYNLHSTTQIYYFRFSNKKLLFTKNLLLLWYSSIED